MTDTPAPDETIETTTAVADPMPIAASMPQLDPPNAAPRRRRPISVILIGLLIAAIGFAGGIAGFYVADQNLSDDGSASDGSASFQPANDVPAIEDDGASTAASDAKSPRAIYRAVAPSVVHIDARITQTDTSFFGIPQERESEGTGSGFVIDADKGYIATNAHVVEGAEELKVSFGTEATGIPAKVIGEDPSSDIAVIKIDPKADELDGLTLRAVTFGDSTRLQVGDPVLAIGNPFGLDRTLTTGVVSALQRDIPSLNDFRIEDVIQTDAAVNPGNSGGPLLDGQGRVIGVNSQIQTGGGNGFDGIAFAVPSSTVKRVTEQLIKDGKVEYAWLGVAGGEITPEIQQEFKLEVDSGVLVGSVTPGSPADKAGIEGGREITELGTGETTREGGDVLLSFNGERLTSMRQLSGLVAAQGPGDEVKIVYLRNGDRKTATVKLGERPDELSSSSSDDN